MKTWERFSRWGRGNFLLLVVCLSFMIGFQGVRSAGAYPELQLYIDGATYDPSTATWTTTASSFDLWLIGDGKFGTIQQVKVAMALFGTGGSVSLTPRTTSALCGGVLCDPAGSVPDADPLTPGIQSPYLWSTGTGSNPPLPDHGIYNDPGLNHWENYYLGDFDKTDSPIGDFMTSFPTSFDSWGQINVYDVTVTGWDRVHFDAFDHTVMTICNKKGCTEKVNEWVSPFSHDALATPFREVPEPATLLLLGSGLLAVGALGWRHARS